MKKAVVIDGNSLIYRAYYATYKQLEYNLQHGIVPNNAIKLMLQMVLTIISDGNYDYGLVCFDHGKKTFRHDQYSEYKAGRKPMPPELVSQLAPTRLGLELIGLNVLSIENIEADDLIGSFAKKCNAHEIRVDIFSSDQDLLQLVNENTHVNLLKTGVSNIVINTVDNFSALNLGLSPKQFCDYKAIIGDSSDNIHGIKGVGPKTASQLLIKYNNLTNIYNHIDELSSTVAEKFRNGKEAVDLALNLVKIEVDHPLEEIESYQLRNIDKEKFSEFIEEYKINSLSKYL